MSNYTASGSGKINSNNTSNSISINLGMVKLVSLISVIFTTLLGGGYYYKNDIIQKLSPIDYPSDHFVENQVLTVITPKGKLRSLPNTSSEPIKLIEGGETVFFSGERSTYTSTFMVNGANVKEYWLRVLVGNRNGYIFGGCLANIPFKIKEAPQDLMRKTPETIPDFEVVSLKIDDDCRILGDGINIRENPGLNENILGMLYRDDMVNIISRTKFKETMNFDSGNVSDYWYHVVVSNRNQTSLTGWVYGKYICDIYQGQSINKKPRMTSQKFVGTSRMRELKPAWDIPSRGVEIYILGELGQFRGFPLNISNANNVSGIVLFDLIVDEDGVVKVVEIDLKTTNIQDENLIISLRNSIFNLAFNEDKNSVNSYRKGQLRISFKSISTRNRN